MNWFWLLPMMAPLHCQYDLDVIRWWGSILWVKL